MTTTLRARSTMASPASASVVRDGIRIPLRVQY